MSDDRFNCNIHSNKEYKMTTKSETIYESKTKHLRYLFDEHGNALPIYNDILDKFTTDEKAYYAGMIDGDGSIQYLKRKDNQVKN